MTRALAPWRKVTEVHGYSEGRGSVLSPDTPRRTRWWELTLECEHHAQRTVRYGPHQNGYARQRGGTQYRSASDILPAPKRVRCDACMP